MLMSNIKTDIDLSKNLGSDIYDEYQNALDFIQIDAGYSLLKFRIITEILCNRALKISNIPTENNGLNSLIDELFQSQVIHYDLNNRLHEVRNLGNKSAHAPVLSSKFSDEDNIRDLKVSYTNQLREEAILARKLTVKNMEDMHSVLTTDKSTITVSMVDIPDNIWAKILVDAATSSCFKTYLKAGKIYEAQANDMRKQDPYNYEPDFCYRYNGLKKLAANYYEMSFRISADIGKNTRQLLLNEIQKPFKKVPDNEPKSTVLVNNDDPNIDMFKEHSNPEALYLYWSVIQETDSFGGEWKPEYQWMLEASAKLGHPEAQAVYACRLLEKGEFDSALSMLEHAITFNIDAGYRGIAAFYDVEGIGKRDIKKAISYLNKGAEINGPECLYTLGKLYYTGTWVEKSESKGKEYILKAIKFGSFNAEDYYFKDILRVKEKQREKFENDISEGLNNVKKFFKGGNDTIIDIGRNDPCTCGSGKKHKKCCLNKEYTQKKAIKDMATSLYPD